MKKYIYSIFFISGVLLTSCSKDFTEPDQTDGFSNDKMEEMAKNPESAMYLNNAIESGVGNKLISWNNDGRSRHDDFGQKAVDLGLDLMSNDMAMIPKTGWFGPYYQYTGRGESYILTSNLWNYYTFIIDNLNVILKNLEKADSSPEVDALKGRVYAMRAHSNFILIRLYGSGDKGIPYATESKKNYGRASVEEINDLIEKDLLLAYDLALPGAASKETLTKPSIAGLLTRFYLYKKDYANVIKYADLALVKYGKAVSFDVINDGFVNVSNPDWMWGKEKNASNSTDFISFFGHMDSYNGGGYVAYAGEFKLIDKRLYDAIPPTDKRKQWFSNGDKEIYGVAPLYANATKFRDKTSNFIGDYIYMRATEIFFNKAEAAAELGDSGMAQTILKDIMSTRDETYTVNKTGTALVEEIRLQRRIELWGEGFAFFDMKRWNIPLTRNYAGTNHADSGRKDYPAGSEKFTFQFPIREIQANDALTPADQNPY
ncbi:RagB/SusD family nutrient uptake outer membrane protein [Myroides odoratimimus]|uniref:RagB/SusD family nutrient uptake outer membrane protein n=1 Tax=Myroides odoratimimus TaxID=76832 RepID=UPI0025760EBB|nr:RagB/SusD family nutrient uptake outer membrane protein [Myroides odoratimimus]MDM1327979.1 RagB/SusD family nutrient uptake outer membrane protein [Myroides odoratimimus]